jgi:hypothetical protein
MKLPFSHAQNNHQKLENHAAFTSFDLYIYVFMCVKSLSIKDEIASQTFAAIRHMRVPSLELI